MDDYIKAEREMLLVEEIMREWDDWEWTKEII